MNRPRTRPVIGLDIDATLGDYHGHFLRFAEGWLGRKLDPDYDGRLPLARHMGVSKTTYRQIKLSYRMGGLKRSMPAWPWASDLTRTLRSWGVDVWLCTSRPYLSHDNIDSDTRHWVRRNRIACQGILWGEHKYRELARTVGRANVVGVLDDLPEMLEQAHSLGFPAVLAARATNRGAELRMNGYHLRAASPEETLAVFEALLVEWKAKTS